MQIPDPLLASSPLLSRIRSTSDHHQIDEDDNTTQQQSLGGFPTDLLRQVVIIYMQFKYTKMYKHVCKEVIVVVYARCFTMVNVTCTLIILVKVEMSKLLALKQERVRMISVFNKEAEKLVHYVFMASLHVIYLYLLAC